MQMSNINRIEVGNRLRLFLKDKYGTLEKGASVLEMKSPSLQNYLKGERLPGAEILSKLSQLGCDIDWLLLGKEKLIENVSDINNESINRKDKIILSQAEELTMMKVKLEELKQRVQELEVEQSKLMAEMGRKKVEEMRKKTISNIKGKEKDHGRR